MADSWTECIIQAYCASLESRSKSVKMGKMACDSSSYKIRPFTIMVHASNAVYYYDIGRFTEAKRACVPSWKGLAFVCRPILTTHQFSNAL